VAIDLGYELLCTNPDQRGYSRVDEACDIGAIEVGASVPVLAIFADGFE
jgi:hypothetical protein